MKNFDLQQLAKDYAKLLNSRSNDDFEINDTQFEKYKEVLSFFRTLTEDSKESEIEMQLEPKETVGGLTSTTYLVSLCGKELQELTRVLSYCSAVTIDTLADGKVCISVTVANMFTKKRTRMMN